MGYFPASHKVFLEFASEVIDGLFEPLVDGNGRPPSEKLFGLADVRTTNFGIINWKGLVGDRGLGAGEGNNFAGELQNGVFLRITEVDGIGVVCGEEP